MKDVRKAAVQYEKEYGTEQFLKVCISVLNKMLVRANICTKEDLQKAFLKEIEELKNGPKSLSE